ncbi:MAG: ribonuclease P protein component [Phycisphaeraceae bacterium]
MCSSTPPVSSKPKRPDKVFRHRHRLHGRADFAAVHRAKMRKHAGPLSVLARPNDRPESRLGMTVSRKVGPAVTRNRIKRLLREAFRLERHDWTPGFDLLVIVRPHTPLALTEYRRLLTQAILALESEWQRRARRLEKREEGAGS